MGKRVRSAKGELIDFDFLKIKEQLASAPPSIEVKKRQNFIENRLKRRLKKKEPVIEKVAVEKVSVEVEPTMPEPAAALEQAVPLEEVEKIVPKTKQKAKKKK